MSAAAPAPLSKTVPFPESEPIVLLNPFRSKTELTVNSEFLLKPFNDPAWSVPALTIVPASVGIVAGQPVKVHVPVPNLMSWRKLVPFSSIPLNIVLVSSLPTTNVACVAPSVKTVPVPEASPPLNSNLPCCPIVIFRKRWRSQGYRHATGPCIAINCQSVCLGTRCLICAVVGRTVADHRYGVVRWDA